ncbi:hypothetical protein BJ166DRAFT_529003 [Pestalotiopsis sp. NC0098]|nr:hypothetical protein BJ166DRAFT_529003 [Pestalotiopsis sp. NC0098]
MTLIISLSFIVTAGDADVGIVVICVWLLCVQNSLASLGRCSMIARILYIYAVVNCENKYTTVLGQVLQDVLFARCKCESVRRPYCMNTRIGLSHFRGG